MGKIGNVMGPFYASRAFSCRSLGAVTPSFLSDFNKQSIPYLPKWFNPSVAAVVDPSLWDRSEYTQGFSRANMIDTAIF